ncbi:hypothetical protein EDD22DRAFT_49358 [Suillus occidentalis]|nr:hypothetical protein EDD22DRAFT_49358 [Suillus occidentalis]
MRSHRHSTPVEFILALSFVFIDDNCYVIDTYLSVYSLLQNSRTTTITVDLNWMTTQLCACILVFAESFTCRSLCQRWRCMRVTMIARTQTCEPDHRLAIDSLCQDILTGTPHKICSQILR